MDAEVFCEGCEHKANNTDPELYCYMFKEAPNRTCAQHTVFKHLRKDFGKVFLGIFAQK